MVAEEAVKPSLPPIASRPPFRIRFIRTILGALPEMWRCRLYRALWEIGPRFGWDRVHHIIRRLPLGLVLKSSVRHSQLVEVAALRFLESAKIAGINSPFLVDSVRDGDKTYMLSTFIEGEHIALHMDNFSPQDWKRLETDLQMQLRSLRHQTSSSHDVCNAAGGVIDDPRMSWVFDDGLRFSTTQEFFTQVWLGLDLPHNRDTIRPVIQPLIERPVPVAFCHGDIYPRNLIFPGGFEDWRTGKSRVCLIDWEYAGWMPEPWEALKATYIECDPDTEWLLAIRRTFPEFSDYLDADWEWRSKSRMMLI